MKFHERVDAMEPSGDFLLEDRHLVGLGEKCFQIAPKAEAEGKWSRIGGLEDQLFEHPQVGMFFGDYWARRVGQNRRKSEL